MSASHEVHWPYPLCHPRRSNPGAIRLEATRILANAAEGPRSSLSRDPLRDGRFSKNNLRDALSERRLVRSSPERGYGIFTVDWISLPPENGQISSGRQEVAISPGKRAKENSSCPAEAPRG